jgi:hypothetical protein
MTGVHCHFICDADLFGLPDGTQQLDIAGSTFPLANSGLVLP